MCGIFGLFHLNSHTVADDTLVSQGISRLTHRGPDGRGIEKRRSVCFGHTRLSIIDLDGGRQPMWSSDQNGLITYNGELYNYRRLIPLLTREGCRFHTHSDTEVVLNAYLAWGPKCLQHFRGMFAFGAVDFKNNRALIARDRIGIKPLFYTVQNNTLYFSSELEPLYRTIGPFKIHLSALDDYLYWQYIHAPRTIYQDVFSLPPAHYIDIDLKTGHISIKRYWSLTFKEDRSLSLSDWVQRLDNKLQESIEMHLISDVRFGAFLSGGIDSSLVVGYMSDILKQPVNTFSIGFEETDYSELKYAQKVAHINRTQHITEIVTPESLSLLPLLVKHYGQPFADSSAIPTYYVSRMARKHVKMVLSGDGGDENFAGYNSYAYIIENLTRSHPPHKTLRSYAAHYLHRCLSLLHPGNILRKAFKLHCGTAQHFSPQERMKLFKEQYRSVIDTKAAHREMLLKLDGQPLINRIQNLDLHAYLPYDILTKVDIASMANSLEVRVPLLDHVLIETAATIPHEYKLAQGLSDKLPAYEKKYILKKLAQQRYPSDIINRPKMGFGLPLGNWFAHELKSQIRTQLLGSSFLPAYFDMQTIESLLDKHSVQYDCSAKIWNLLFLESWMNTHNEALS